MIGDVASVRVRSCQMTTSDRIHTVLPITEVHFTYSAGQALGQARATLINFNSVSYTDERLSDNL